VSGFESKTVSLHGRNVAYAAAGSGPVLLLIHGMAGNFENWRDVIAPLARQHTVIAPDLPGHGASEPGSGDYSLGALAASLRDLLLLLGHDRATLVGHSLGGGIAMQFAYQFPEMTERLVLVSSGGLGPEVSPVLRAAALPGADIFIAATAGPGSAVGSVVGLSAAVGGWLMVRWMPVPDGGQPGLVAILCGLVAPLAVGPLFGLFAGLVVTKIRIPSFIVTLGTLMIGRSLTLVVTQGQPIPDMPAFIQSFGQGRWIDLPLPLRFAGFAGSGSPADLIFWLPVQNIVWVALLVYALGWFLLEWTAFGKRVYAVGANRTVAIMSGIRADRIKIACMMIVGFSASVAGIVSLSRLGAVSPNTGEGLEFEVIAAVVIGGTSLSGGQGNILRTIIGVAIIALTRNFLNLARIQIFWQGFATGAIILAAVLLEALQRRISERR